MARKPRELVAGGIYHVYARGNNRQEIALDDVDRRRYLALVAREVRRRRWRCLSYCLMPNHVHLLLETPDPDLDAGMQRLQSGYAQRFNARHGRGGHVFQGRYGAVRVTDDAQLMTVVGYIAANPVTAGLCDTPEAWRWSSHAATAQRRSPGWMDAGRLDELVGAAGGDPLCRCRDLVADRLGRA
jgi:REP element-mobilizing transposase RayT